MAKTEITGKKYQKGENMSYSISDAMMLSGFGIYNILHMLMSGLIHMGMMMQSLVLGYVIPAAECELELTTQQKGLLTAIPFIAIVITSCIWGWLGDIQGRRPVILCSMMGSTILSVISSFAPEIFSFAVLQLLSALFMAATTAIVYTYLGEFNNNQHRDKMITMGASFIGVATIVLPCLAWLILPLEISYQLPILNITYRSWRLLIVAVSAPFAIGTVLIILFASETPIFLYSTGRHNEALVVLKTIFSVNTRKSKHYFPVKKLVNEEGQTTTYSHKNILNSMKEQMLPLFQPPILKWTCLTSFVQFTLFAGSLGFFVWAPTILNSVASSTSTNMKICDILDSNRIAISIETDATSNATATCDDSVYSSTYLRSIYIGLFFFSMYIIIGIFVNFMSKKYILLVSLTLTGLCAIGAGVVPHVQVAVILFGVLQMSGACIGLVNAVAVELFPTKYRAMGICLSVMIGYCGCMVASNLIGWFLENYCVGGFCLSGALLVVCGLLCLTLPNDKKTKLFSSVSHSAYYTSTQEVPEITRF